MLISLTWIFASFLPGFYGALLQLILNKATIATPLKHKTKCITPLLEPLSSCLLTQGKPKSWWFMMLYLFYPPTAFPISLSTFLLAHAAPGPLAFLVFFILRRTFPSFCLTLQFSAMLTWKFPPGSILMSYQYLLKYPLILPLSLELRRLKIYLLVGVFEGRVFQKFWLLIQNHWNERVRILE